MWRHQAIEGAMRMLLFVLISLMSTRTWSLSLLWLKVETLLQSVVLLLLLSLLWFLLLSLIVVLLLQLLLSLLVMLVVFFYFFGGGIHNFDAVHFARS